jgi:hypothetical protein
MNCTVTTKGRDCTQADVTFPTELQGYIPSYYTNTSVQVLCPGMPVYFSSNPSLVSTDTGISRLFPGQVEIVTTGYYDIQVIVLIAAIGTSVATCSTTPVSLPSGCGYPTFALAINGRQQNGSVYSLGNTSGQLYGVASFLLKQKDILSLVNVSLCPVALGGPITNNTYPLNQTTSQLGACGLGNASSTIQLTLRGIPTILPSPYRCGCSSCASQRPLAFTSR